MPRGAAHIDGTAAEPMPRHVKPMLAELATMPPEREDYGFEFKWDGVRAIAYWDGRTLRLESRNLLDVTDQYPEIAGLGKASGLRSAIFDGEIVALDERGRVSFSALQRRMHVVNAAHLASGLKSTPVFYMLFDLLYVDGRSTMSLPYTRRREFLENLDLSGEHWQTPPYQVGKGEIMLSAATASGLEGVMAKRLDSAYEPGKRNGNWLKIKVLQRQEFVIGGWLPYRREADTGVGALLLGYYDDAGRLTYAGKVGTGFTEPMRLELMRKLKAIPSAENPFRVGKPERGAIFCQPKLVGEVEFFEWTPDGSVRHPSFKGLREDKAPREVVRERPRKIR